MARDRAQETLKIATSVELVGRSRTTRIYAVPSRSEATVRVVVLRADGSASCDCPWVQLRKKGCAHIGAAILCLWAEREAQRQARRAALVRGACRQRERRMSRAA